MQKKIFNVAPKGVQQDMQVGEFPNSLAFSMENIRILPNRDGTGSCLVNELGNEYIDIGDLGEVLGVQTLNDYVVFFSKKENKDIITRFTYSNGTLNNKVELYRGNLNFSNKIQSLGIYESENVQKVYWIDGINPNRVINIVGTKDTSKILYPFDFLPSIELKDSISVTKNPSGGLFPSGVIQYVYQYYDKHGRQSNLVNYTDLIYLCQNKGIKSDDTYTGSFTLTISNVDKSFDYIRVYSITRTSIDAEVTVKRVIDIPIDSDTISFTDTGTLGDTVTPKLLLYLNLQKSSSKAMNHKDGTLFLGNIKLLEDIVFSKENIEYIKNNSSVEFIYKELHYDDINDYYKYRGILNEPSSKVCTFKYGEIYRIGVQFQTVTGNYSEVVYLGDIHNNIKPYVDENSHTIYTSQIKCTLPSLSSLNQEFVKARLVMVPPTDNDRSIICQGIICPTVYNLSKRLDNNPFVQASWMLRSSMETHNYELPSNNSSEAEIQSIEKNSEGDKVIYFNKGSIKNIRLEYWYIHVASTSGFTPYWYIWKLYDGDTLIDSYEKEGSSSAQGAYEWSVKALKKYLAESLIPTKNEWENHQNEGNKGVITANSSLNIKDSIKDYSSNFFIDTSILTLYSPDVEDNYYLLHNKQVKFRILGSLKLDGKTSSYNIESSTPSSPETVGQLNYKFPELKSEYLWNDKCNNGEGAEYNFLTYMWHGLSLSDSTKTENSARSSLLMKKTFSNTRWATKTNYFETPWEAYQEDSVTNTGITPTQVFNSNELSLIKITPPLNSNLEPLHYFGNVDYGLTSEYTIKGKPAVNGVTIGEVESIEGSKRNDLVRMSYKTTPHVVFALNYTVDNKVRILPAIGNEIGVNNYSNKAPLWRINSDSIIYVKHIVETIDDRNSLLDLEKNDLVYVRGFYGLNKFLGNNSWSSIYLSNGTIFAQGDNIYRYYYTSNPEGHGYISWIEGQAEDISQDIVKGSYSSEPVIYIGELYREIGSDSIYGGDPEKNPEVLKSNLWIPIGENTRLSSSTILYGTLGDTYYQRWDCLMTYPYTNESLNNVIDVTSFMVESRINLDSRYDDNRGQPSNLSLSPTNFNLFNPVYSQSNNFFNYRNTGLELNTFLNQVTWSETKNNEEEIDSWTHITLANTIDADGDKGEVTAIRRMSNELLLFQSNAVSRIMYNSRAIIQSSDGVPLEIANGGKVDGLTYISNTCGCQNPYCIVDTNTGIIWYDGYNRGLFRVSSNGVEDLSYSAGMSSWYKNLDCSPTILYDRTTSDIYTTTPSTSIAYNEALGRFTSFYSYNDVDYLFSVRDTSFQVKDNKVWRMHSGEYNTFWETSYPFSIEVIANPEFSQDKIFETLEFRTGTLVDNTFSEPSFNEKNSKLSEGHYPFDNIYVENEYQKASSSTAGLKKKFRIWRWQLPRDGRNRIRNPWTKIRIENLGRYNEEVRLYDMQVHYYM